MDDQVFQLIMNELNSINTKVDELIAFKHWVLGLAASAGTGGGLAAYVVGSVIKNIKGEKK